MAGGGPASLNPPGGPAASVRLVRVRVPLRSAHAAAHGTERVREVVLVGWARPDGVTGWGECPTLSAPGYATETTAQAWRALVGELAPAAVAGRGLSEEELPSGAVAATSALRDARLDAALRAAGTALGDHLGATRGPLDRCAVLADLGAEPGQVAAGAAEAVAAGAAMVKVKIAPGRDLAVLRAVVDSVGGAAVAADANGSYSDPAQLAALDELGLRYLEQPFPAGLAPDRYASMHAGLRTPVALDESLTSVGALRELLEHGALGVVSVKPARLGGVEAAAAAVELAARWGVDAFVGGMLELGIGRAAAAAVAALDGCTLPTDLGPSERYVALDVCDPVVADEAGRLVRPEGPGIGRTPDEERLARFAVEDRVIS